MINHAIILAAGRGVRMMPRTKKIPKAMVKIKNQTLILKGIKKIQKYIKNIHITVGYKGSMLTLTYESNKAIPNYNVMGVCKSALEASVKYLARDLGTKGMRVNAISAGPIKTLAASAIGDAKFLYKWNEDHSFLKRNVDIHDVGNSALYLLSDLANGVTGEIHYVDAGYNKVGMPDPKNIS